MSKTYRKVKMYFEEDDFEDESSKLKREAKEKAKIERQKRFEELLYQEGLGDD
jgi:hypothetical protein